MMIIAHRGASGTAPENTLASFRGAIECGAEWLELDVRASRDGGVVVMHDALLDRTTNGRGPVSRFTLAELKRLDAGAWFHRRFAGERIPTLEEVVSVANASGVGMLIEMKPGPHLGQGFEQKVVSALVGSRAPGQCFVMSFDHAAVLRAKRLEPKLKTLLLVEHRTNTDKLVEAVLAHQAEGVSVSKSLASRSLVNALHARGLRIVVWTVNPVHSMKRYLEREVDGITTDYPERLRRLVLPSV